MAEEKFLNAWRLKWHPRALLFAVVMTFIISGLAGQGNNPSDRATGDYPVFYSAGQLIFDQTGKSLYNFNDEAELQKGMFPDNYPGNIVVAGHTAVPFPYPPFVALAYYPLSLLNYRPSYLIHTLFMIFALGLATYLLCRNISFFRGLYDLVLYVALFFYPTMLATFGGQNAPITFLLYVAIWWAGIRNRQALAGFFLGLMLFKPQFALPLMGLHFLSGRYKTVVVSLVVALALYLIGVVTYGTSWLVDWFHYASWVSGVAANIGRGYSVSWIGFLQALLGVNSPVALISGTALALLTAAMISFVWYRERHNPDLSVRFGLAPIALLLIPSHVMYYDVGLILFTYAVCLDRATVRVMLLIGLLWLLAPIGAAGIALGLNPQFFNLLLSGVLAVHVLIPDIKLWARAGQNRL